MKSTKQITRCMAVFALSSAAVFAQDTPVRPAPEVQTRPAATPQEIEVARKRAIAEREAARVAREADGAKRRGVDAVGVDANAAGRRGPAPAEMRKAAAALSEQESLHRDRMARMRRLNALYAQEGNETKLAVLQELRTKEVTRYGNYMDGQRAQFGPETFKKLEGMLRRGRANEAAKPGERSGRQPVREGQPKRDVKQDGQKPRNGEGAQGGGR